MFSRVFVEKTNRMKRRLNERMWFSYCDVMSVLFYFTVFFLYYLFNTLVI